MSGCCGVDEYERITRDTLSSLARILFLQRNYREYLRLIMKLDRFRMLRCILHPQELVGTFVVEKKSSKIRMILGSGRTNKGFDGVVARSTEAVRFFEESVAHLATVDVDNCFHRLCIGQSLAEWWTGGLPARGSAGPWDSVGPCPVHYRTTNRLCKKRSKKNKTFRSWMTAHNLVSSTSRIQGES